MTPVLVSAAVDTASITAPLLSIRPVNGAASGVPPQFKIWAGVVAPRFSIVPESTVSEYALKAHVNAVGTLT